MFSADNILCAWKMVLLPTKDCLTPPQQKNKQTKRKVFFPPTLPPTRWHICSLQSTTGPPSLWPVAMLFHLPCWYRGLHAGRLQLGSQSFSIYQRTPHTHTFPAGRTHYHLQHQFRDIAFPDHPCPHLFPPALHIFLFLSAQKGYLKRTIENKQTKKNRYCGHGSLQVREADSAVLLLRPLTWVITLESGKYRPCVTQGIQQIALTKLVMALNSGVRSLGWDPGENSVQFHSGF